jgi:hypothetical protein
MKLSICAFVFAAAMLVNFTAKSNYSVSTATPNTSIEKTAALDPLPVSGTNAFGTFTGTFDIQNFVNRSRQLTAIGTLTGTFTDLLGNVTQISQTVSIPVSSISASCQILHLELGPLDLNLLGLTVHLDRVVLDITAVAAPGNLLGILLCAIANLLNGGASFTAIANLLNFIFAIIG